MRATPEELLVERIFNKYGDSFAVMSIEDAYDELKNISGQDYGYDEEKWRNWLAKRKSIEEEKSLDN